MSGDSKRILILGGTGFVGRELGRRLCEQGHTVILTARRPEEVRGGLPFPCEIMPWAGSAANLPPEALEGCDGVVNLVGEGIADKPWTSARRQAIVASRVESVAALARAIRDAGQKPRVVVQASAVGYYGDRGDEVLNEDAGPGRGFLADTCVAWEREAAALSEAGVRTVMMRVGFVLGLTGGALPKMMGVYAKSLGAELGSGRQWTSWIHIDDLTAMIVAALTNEGWRGAVNATAPVPCQNAELNAALARHGRFKAQKRVPALVLRAAMGARAALVLDSVRAPPTAALRYGFRFRHETVESAMADLLGDAVDRNLRRLVTRQWVAWPPDRIWPFFADAKNLERITPPWLGFKVLRSSTPSIGQGTVINYALRVHGLPVRWESEICDWDAGRRFVDTQRKGPYAVWHHTHIFESLAGGTLMTDSLQYSLPVAPLGELVAGALVSHDVATIFAYRSRAVAGMGEQDFGG